LASPTPLTNQFAVRPRSPRSTRPSPGANSGNNLVQQTYRQPRNKENHYGNSQQQQPLRIQKRAQPTSGGGPLLAAERFSMVAAPPTDIPVVEVKRSSANPSPSPLRHDINHQQQQERSRTSVAVRDRSERESSRGRTAKQQRSQRRSSKEEKPNHGRDTPSTASTRSTSSESPERSQPQSSKKDLQASPSNSSTKSPTYKSRAAKLNEWRRKSRYYNSEESMLKEGIRECIKTAKCVGLNMKECVMVSADVYNQECITQHAHRGDDDLFLGHREQQQQQQQRSVYDSPEEIPKIYRNPSSDHSLMNVQNLEEDDADELMNPPKVKRAIPADSHMSPTKQPPQWLDSFIGREGAAAAATYDDELMGRPDQTRGKSLGPASPQGRPLSTPPILHQSGGRAYTPPTPTRSNLPQSRSMGGGIASGPLQQQRGDDYRDLRAVRLSMFEQDSSSQPSSQQALYAQQLLQQQSLYRYSQQQYTGQQNPKMNVHRGVHPLGTQSFPAPSQSAQHPPQPYQQPYMDHQHRQGSSLSRQLPTILHQQQSVDGGIPPPPGGSTTRKGPQQLTPVPGPAQRLPSPEPVEMGVEVRHEDFTRVQEDAVQILQQQLSQTKQKLDEAMGNLQATRHDSALEKLKVADSTDKLFRERVEVEEQLRKEMKSKQQLAEQIKDLENETKLLRTSLLQAKSGASSPESSRRSPDVSLPSVGSGDEPSDCVERKIVMVTPPPIPDSEKQREANQPSRMQNGAVTSLEDRRKVLRQKEMNLSKLVDTLRAQRDGDSSVAEYGAKLMNESLRIPPSEANEATTPKRRGAGSGGDKYASCESSVSDVDPVEQSRSEVPEDSSKLVGQSSLLNRSVVPSPNTYQRKQQEWESQKVADRKKRQEIEAQMDTLQSELVVLRLKLEAAVAERIAADDKVSSLERENSMVRDEAKKLRFEASNLRRVVHGLKMDKTLANDSLQEEMDMLRCKLGEAEETERRRANEKAEADQDMLNNKKETELLREEAQKFKDEVTSLKHKLDLTLDEIEDQSRDKQKLEDELAKSKAEAQRLKGEVARFMNELERSKMAVDVQKRVSSDEAKDLQEEVKRMKEKLSETNAEIVNQAREHLAQRKKLEEELQRTRESAHVLQHKVIAMDDNIATAENEAQILRVKLQEEETANRTQQPLFNRSHFGTFFSTESTSDTGCSQPGEQQSNIAASNRSTVIERLRKTLDATT